jgi:long-subunit fatty acid transport protein
VRTENGENIRLLIDPQIINYYPSYRLQTPWSLGASAAYIFGGRALLSFDYGYKDYSSMRYSPGSDFFFAEQNRVISNTFKGASSFRGGAEFRIQQVSLRGGYRFEESPYRNDVFFGDLEGYSFGLGYNFGMLRIDGSFSQAQRDYQYRLFDVGMTDTVQLNNRLTDVIITLSLVF